MQETPMTEGTIQEAVQHCNQIKLGRGRVYHVWAAGQGENEQTFSAGVKVCASNAEEAIKITKNHIKSKNIAVQGVVAILEVMFDDNRSASEIPLGEVWIEKLGFSGEDDDGHLAGRLRIS